MIGKHEQKRSPPPRFLRPSWYRTQFVQMRQKALGEHSLVILGAAQKTGSTWLKNLLYDIGAFSPLRIPPEMIGERRVQKVDVSRILGNVKIPRGRYLHRTTDLHSPSPDLLQGRENVKLLTIVRDPRDLVVSGAFYLKNIPEEVGGWGSEFGKLSDKERIFQLLDKWYEIPVRLRNWYNNPYVHKVRYEDLLNNGPEVVVGIFDYLGLPKKTKTIQSSYLAHSFEKQSGGRKSGEEDATSFHRKGIAGDWKNYFDEDVVQHFKTARDGEWQAVLEELGYEKDSNW